MGMMMPNMADSAMTGTAGIGAGGAGEPVSGPQANLHKSHAPAGKRQKHKHAKKGGHGKRRKGRSRK